MATSRAAAQCPRGAAHAAAVVLRGLGLLGRVVAGGQGNAVGDGEQGSSHVQDSRPSGPGA